MSTKNGPLGKLRTPESPSAPGVANKTDRVGEETFSRGSPGDRENRILYVKPGGFFRVVQPAGWVRRG